MKKRKVATITVKGVGKMSARERKDVAQWLAKFAKEFTKRGDQYTDGLFRASFGYHG